MMSLPAFAQALGGKIVSGGVSFAPSWHSDPRDLSGRLIPDPTFRNGYRAKTFSPADDPLRLRDYIDQMCGLPRFEHRADYRAPEPSPAEQARREEERERLRLVRAAEDKIRAERLLRIWHAADEDPGGLVRLRYLREIRRVELPDEACGYTVRFHRACPWEGDRVPAMVCAFRDLHTNEVVGLHRTRLDPETGAKIGRRMLGRVTGAAIMLTPPADVTMGLHIAEGVESALAGMMLDLRPMWATGSAGGIASFPVLGGLDVLTICAETDRSGANAAAIQECGTRWVEAGRAVDVVQPRGAGDMNDVLTEEPGR
ncbi:DUF7146 domain-containing protein [Methylobacterium nonmethylotrophicum]|uniref:DUF7146 domain-containing protein n=1 Tax=Methylobacterium nonmethylotrophicum TaxID=1141884 RepID=A0A4Z0NFA6_9HYPH|nr:toprim domain-containing protein [Methylobacterium nonmethylotrophicum]TGD93731.1 hypothetical protein EU555_33130 [Methylobacterium nonmethylotrophicum]